MSKSGTRAPKILAVDDEEFNLDLLTTGLSEAGYDVVAAEDGAVALRKLEEHPDVEVVVLDRMMPNMDGMEFVRTVKAIRKFQDVAVIMQTAAAESAQILEGIKAGVYYYLTKPYEDVMLLSIVKAALRDVRAKKEMKEDVRHQRRMLGLMVQSSFRFRTLDDTKTLAFHLANCFPDPGSVVYGLSELLINAVEHGNLGITYAEKTKLVLNGCWQQEVERRLALPGNGEKLGLLEFRATANEIAVHIKDQGEGFNWQKYVELSPERATDPHGRGIATARILSFDSIEYLGSGNEVVCKIRLTGKTLSQPLLPAASVTSYTRSA